MAIFSKLGRAVEGAADLLEIKARSAAVAFGEVGVALLIVALAGFLGVVMILGLLAALTVALWEPLGPAGAIAIAALAAGLLALVGLLIGRWLIKRVGSPPPETTVRQKEWSARERLNMRTPPRFSPVPPPAAALPPPSPSAKQYAAQGASPPPPKQPNVKVVLARKAYEHPKIAAGAAFAALAILGPKKSLRTLTRGLALAGVAMSAARVAREAMESSEERQPHHAPPPPPAPPADPPRERPKRSASENGAAARRGGGRIADADDPTIIA